MTVRVLQLLPELLDVNGDAQNALVLAQRLRWSGIDADVVTDPDMRPDLVVVGSGVDTELAQVADLLRPLRERLAEWVDAGTAMLAVGTGFELLSTRLTAAGTEHEGLGIFDGAATPLQERALGDLVVETTVGRLVGFENHARGWTAGSGSVPMGSVITGHGNDGRSEGARQRNAWGTHLHGPVLAKNPSLADELLRTAAPGYTPDDERTRFADAMAEAARRAITG